MPTLFARAEAVIERWLEAFGDDCSSPLQGARRARLRCASAQPGAPEAQARIRRLASSDGSRRSPGSDPGVVAYVGMALQWQPAEALRLMREHKGDYRAEAVYYELEAVSGREPVVPPVGLEWFDSERMLSWGLLVQGRLDELLAMLPRRGRLASGLHLPHAAPAPRSYLAATADLARARALLDQVPAATREGAHTDLWHFHEAWLLWAEGDYPGALRAAEAAVDHSRRTRFGWEPCFHVVVGCMLIAVGRIDDARSVLADSISQSAGRRLGAYLEVGPDVPGARLPPQRRPKDAARVLRRRWPTCSGRAGTCCCRWRLHSFSEAEHRGGELSASDRAADRAMTTAAATGSYFLLSRALMMFRTCSSASANVRPQDDRWRRLGGTHAVMVGRGGPRPATN